MSQTSVSEAPIIAETVEVLDNITEHTMSLNTREEDKKLQMSTHRGFTTSTVSETSDHSSSVLWTPQILPQNTKKTKSRRERKKEEKGRRLWNEEDIQKDMDGETSPFLTAQGQPTKPKQSCSFERHQHNRSSHGSHHHNRSRRNTEKSSFRRSQGHKNRHELNNDYTKYQYHRRSHRNKHRKHNSLHQQKDESTNNAHSGLPKIIQRIKDFFLGKKSEKRKNQAITQELREHLSSEFKETSLQGRHNSRRHISQKLFRSASDSDIEVVKHHRRRQCGNEESKVKDDLCKDGRHWKTKRVRNGNKLSSICESSEKLGGLDRGSGSDGRLVLTKSGSTMYNDIKFNGANKNKHKRSSKKNGQKMEKRTSDESHSQESLKTKEKHRRRSKDYQNLKRKWAKQHQSFENDLEKLEKLVKSINMKKPHAWTEQKPLEDTTLLERLEAKQEKCVAEVDFTRHVLVCKLQRLENKLEESLSVADNNNNTNSKERRKTIEEIREEMSKECRDLRKLLQETSDQLKQVLEERPTGNSQKDIMNENNDGRKTQKESLSEVKTFSKNKPTSHIDDLKSNPNIPFPELSHHPLNIGRSHIVAKCVSEDNNNNKHIVATCVKEESSGKQHTRVSTYV